MDRIICVLVLYNPDIKLINPVIQSIISQVDLLWISDNTPSPVKIPIIDEFQEKIIYKKMDGNIGIAAAQNYGIKYAIENNYKYLYYLDQDSISPKNIISELKSKYEYLKAKNYNIGAVGPKPFNRGENKDYNGSIKKGVKIENNILEVTELISSASFIEVSTFKEVGMMEEKLFIDGVDHEWCWRGRFYHKKRFFIAENIKLSHQLGEGDRRFLWKKVAIPTPFRTYYQYRNYFILLKRNYVPLYWKMSNGIKYSIKLFYFPLCISPRISYLKRIFKGIKDGIRALLTNNY